MAFSFDSLAAPLLFAACLVAWLRAARARAASRTTIRFAAMLFSVLAVARGLSLVMPQFPVLAPPVALIAASLGGTALMLGLFAVLARPVPPLAAALALSLALASGLAAALSAAPAYAMSCQILGACLTMAAAFSGPGNLRGAIALLACLSLLCGGFCLMDGALDMAALFFASSLISAAEASQMRVQAERQDRLLRRVDLRR